MLLVNGSNRRVIPVQRASKKEVSLPFTMKDVDPNVTSTTHVSLGKFTFILRKRIRNSGFIF